MTFVAAIFRGRELNESVETFLFEGIVEEVVSADSGSSGSWVLGAAIMDTCDGTYVVCT